MAIFTIEGPGGPRSLVVNDGDLLATLEANARRDGLDYHVDHSGESTGEPTRNDDLTVAELRDIAENLGIDVPKGIKKAELAALVAEHQDGYEPSDDED